MVVSMKVVYVIKKSLLVFICFVVCISGIIILSLGKAIQVNATPATNKVVVLDARSRSSRLWNTKCKWYNGTRVEFGDNIKVTTTLRTEWNKSR